MIPNTISFLFFIPVLSWFFSWSHIFSFLTMPIRPDFYFKICFVTENHLPYNYWRFESLFGRVFFIIFWLCFSIIIRMWLSFQLIFLSFCRIFRAIYYLVGNASFGPKVNVIAVQYINHETRELLLHCFRDMSLKS